MVTTVKAHGMDHLVAPTYEDLAERLSSSHGDERKAFDPLMRAHSMVIHRVLSQGGAELLQPGPDGKPKCPVCEAVKHPHDDPDTGELVPPDEVVRHYADGPMRMLAWRAYELGLLEST